MKSNFDFLSRDFPVLANFGKLAEQYCFSDANSCLIKLGMIGENIVNLIFTYDGIDLPYDNTAVTRIDTLMREGLLTRDLCDILHAIRKARNKATHENYGSTDEAKTLLQMTYSLCEWFMQTYGDWNYQNQPFVMPSETEMSNSVVADKEQEKKIEDELTKEAEKTAKQKTQFRDDMREILGDDKAEISDKVKYENNKFVIRIEGKNYYGKDYLELAKALEKAGYEPAKYLKKQKVGAAA